MEKNSLGNIIYKTLKTFYPHNNIGITPEIIEGILNKAGISKKNSSKEEIAKIIKILKHHIELSQQDKKKKIEPQTYTPIFTDMEQKNNYLDEERIKYFDNLTKMREEENKNITNQNDIIPQSLRIKEFMEEDQNEYDHYIIVDSKDRNFVTSSNPSNYIITLGNPNIEGETQGFIPRNYTDVVSVELIQFSMKHTFGVNNASDETDVPPYLLLEVDEFKNKFDGTSEQLGSCFYRLAYYDLIDHGASKYRHYQIEDSMSKKIFKPRKNLTRLTIKIKTPTGSIYNFGDDTDDANTTFNTFTLRITTLQKNYLSNFIQKSN